VPLLAIPMMSAECEWVFSSAKPLITNSETALTPISSKEVPAVKGDENDTGNDDVVYEVDSDGDIIWRDD
jgi:hAT family C-terminal dimerisation region